MRKTLVEDQRFPTILQGKVDIANCVKFATTMQLHVVALIFTTSLFSSVLKYAENTNVVVHGRDNL